MTYLTSSPSQPDHWRLGRRELASGDVIEVLLLGTWYRAHYQEDVRGRKLRIRNCSCSLPIFEGRPARWPVAAGKRAKRPASQAQPGQWEATL